ncbi:MAG: hypothetical protein ACTHKQ_21425 [Mesorhizobium sp.]
MAKVSYTAAALAAELEVAPKALRVYLRTPESGIESVGKGGRYSIEMTATQLAKFKKNFAAWSAAKEAAKAKALEEKAAKELTVLTVATPADLDMTEVDEEPEGPNAADLSDADFAEMLDEIANEDDEVEA